MAPRTSLLLLIVALVLAAGAGVAWLLRSEPASLSPHRATPAEGPAEPSGEAPPPVGRDATAGGLPADPAARPVQPIEGRGAALAVIEGRVIDRGGQGLTDARLQLLLLTDQQPFRTRRPAGLEASSDGEGRFRLVGAPAGAVLALEVQHADHAPSLREPFSVAVGQTLDLGEIVLEAGLTLNGTVTDVTGQPLAGASVSLTDVATLQVQPTPATPVAVSTTDEQGRYTLPHLALRQYAVEASAAGYGRATTVLSLVLGTPSGAWRQDFQLHPADSLLGGVVLDPDGAPVPDATVRISQREQRNNTYFLDTRPTNAEGAFLFEDLTDGRYQVDVLSTRCYLPRPVDLAAGSDSHTIVVQRALEIHGQLQAQAPLPGSFQVQIRPDGRTGAGLVGGAAAQRSFTDAEPPGAFVFDGLRPGSYRFEVAAPGFAPTTSQDVLLGAEAPRTDVVIPLTRGGELRGRLLPPAAGVRVELRGDDYDPALAIESTFPTPPLHGLATRTDEDGAFRLEHVPAGSYTLSALAPAAPPLHLRSVVVAEEQVLDLGALELPVGGVVFGNVLGADGLPRQGVRVMAQGEQHQQQAVTDAQGGFRLDALPPGDYELVASPGNLWEALRFDARQTVSVAAGEEQPVLLTLTERATQPR